MKSKWFLAFTVLGLSIAGAKSYDITLSKATKAGSLQLEPGTYKVALDGTKVRFTAVKTGKEFETTVKVESVEKKFSDTAVETNSVDGGDKIEEIDLGGTRTKVEFN